MELFKEGNQFFSASRLLITMGIMDSMRMGEERGLEPRCIFEIVITALQFSIIRHQSV